MKLAIIILIIIFVLLMFLAFKYFELEIVQVVGNSMKPTYRNKHLVLIRKNFQYVNTKLNYSNNCFIFSSPDNCLVIKRLVNIQFCNGEYYYWFEGDNPEVSRDSRHYGFVTQDKIIGALVFHRKNRNIKKTNRERGEI